MISEVRLHAETNKKKSISRERKSFIKMAYLVRWLSFHYGRHLPIGGLLLLHPRHQVRRDRLPYAPYVHLWRATTARNEGPTRSRFTRHMRDAGQTGRLHDLVGVFLGFSLHLDGRLDRDDFSVF